MDGKLKIYAVSMMAFSPLIDADEPRNSGTYVESLPALIPAESIERAADEARAFALDRWKPAEDWHSHQASIEPVTAEFIEAASKAREAGMIETKDDEQPRTFRF